MGLRESFFLFQSFPALVGHEPDCVGRSSSREGRKDGRRQTRWIGDMNIADEMLTLCFFFLLLGSSIDAIHSFRLHFSITSHYESTRYAVLRSSLPRPSLSCYSVLCSPLAPRLPPPLSLCSALRTSHPQRLNGRTPPHPPPRRPPLDLAPKLARTPAPYPRQRIIRYLFRHVQSLGRDGGYSEEG
jgi:hypothetical protein